MQQEPRRQTVQQTRFGIGQSVRRLEDQRFLTGSGRYLYDINLPRQSWGAVVLSPHAHAVVRRVDVSKAAASEGVLLVLTGADVLAEGLGGLPPKFMPEDMGGPKGYRTYRSLLVTDRVRSVGDRVAFIVAETAEQARQAAELVEVDYEPLPAVVDIEDAVRPGAPILYEDWKSNVSCGVMFGNKDATDAAFAAAKHVVKLRLESNRISANSIEPRGVIGDWNAADDTYTLHSSNQDPHALRKTLADYVFKQSESKFRVIAPDVGGGFGMKADAYPEDGLVLWASRRLRRPVKWIATRSESLQGDNHGRDQVVVGELALDADAKILGVRAKSMHGFGAYVMSAAVAPLVFSLRFIPSVYDVRAFHGLNQGIFTNKTPTGPYRGAGRPEATYLIERLLDRAADELGIDPVEIRRRNLIGASQLPYSTQTGYVYDSGDFAGMLDRCLALADWNGFATRRAATESKGRLRGRSVTFFIEQGGIFNDRMEVRFTPTGTVAILAGTHSHGQGHATVFAQLVAEWLGVPITSIRYVQGDTDQVPFGRGTYAARSSMLGGSALRLACDQIIEKGKRMAARMMEASAGDVEFADGRFKVVGTDRSVAMTDVAKACYAPAGLPKDFGVGLDGIGSWAAEPPNFPNGCHACEVEVDPRTGEVFVVSYAAVDDVGRALNPMICEGQIQGGIAQGLGQALMENVAYDRTSGQLLSGSFTDYAMPRADDMPEIHTELAEIPCKTNPIGVKAIGESGTIGAPAAIVNAILDALKPLGVKHIDMPATPERVWQAIRAAKAA
jgi:carbon-monoxide dehydrogenase large subunit